MRDPKEILAEIHALAAAAAENISVADDSIGVANAIASRADNLVGPEDGFHRFEVAPDVGDAAFIVAYDSTTAVMTIRNLTTGESQGVAIGFQAIPFNGSQIVAFENLGVTLELNAAFDKATSIDPSVSTSMSVGGTAAIDPETIEIASASGSGAEGLTGLSVAIDGTFPGDAQLTIGGYSASGVDLSEPGRKLVTLTEGEESFAIAFSLLTAFSAADTGHVTVDGLGAMLFSEAVSERPSPFVEQTRVAAASVETRLNSQSAEANRLEAEDGFASIAFDGLSRDALFMIDIDVDKQVLSLRNLATGESEGVRIDQSGFTPGDSMTVGFDGLGATVVLNQPLDDQTFEAPSADRGAFFIEHETVHLGGPFGESIADLTEAVVVIDAVSADNAALTVGGFSASGVDLSSTGHKTATLTDGVSVFDIEFNVLTAFSDGDSDTLALPELGQLVFADAVGPFTHIGTGGQDFLSGRIAGEALDVVNIMRGGDGGDRLNGLGGDDDLNGGGGDDVVNGGDGDDVMLGGRGDDVLSGGAGADEAKGGAGADRILGGADADSLFGHAGDDEIFGEAGQDQLFGAGGDDILDGGAGDDLLFGGLDDDVLFGREGDDRLRGGDGGDVLAGNAGDDVILGDDGDDSITGHAGFDRIRGGAGADVFRFVAGADVDKIYDFEDGVDRINLAGHASLNAFADLRITAINGGLDTKIVAAADPTSGDFIILVGIDPGDITADDFVF